MNRVEKENMVNGYLHHKRASYIYVFNYLFI